MSGPPSQGLLATALDAAVPLRIMEIRQKGSEAWWASVQANREEWTRLLCEKGDVLQYGGGKKGEAADAFNALALALAHLAFVPGGVKFAGQRWEERWDAD